MPPLATSPHQSVWKNASSVILFNTQLRHVLMLRRGPSAKFMPNSSVFPGGVLDKSDLHFPREKTDFGADTPSPSCLGLADDFALRVCAVRELFEEAGLLPVVEGPHHGGGGGTNCVIANAEEDAHLAEWRQKVMVEPELFVRLFYNKFRMNVSALIPWSNWLTPLDIRPTPRFNTVFFLLPLNTSKLQKVDHCIREMVEAEWIEPSQIIAKNARGEVSLPPPQFYELSRLQQRIESFKNEDDIRKRVVVDPRRITPHIFRCSDGSSSTLRVNALPGDALYDETNADFKAPVYGDAKELCPPYPAEGETKPIHRIVFHSTASAADPLQYTRLKLFVRNVGTTIWQSNDG